MLVCRPEPAKAVLLDSKMIHHFSKVSCSNFLNINFLDLDIDLDKIKLKFLAIMTQRGFDQNDIAQYDDMNGPVLVAIIFGLLLSLKGKLEFGSIYGFGLTGCIGI